MCYLQNHDKAPTQNLVAAPVAMIAAAMGVESFMITGNNKTINALFLYEKIVKSFAYLSVDCKEIP